MAKKKYKRVFHVLGGYDEIEIPQPTKWERIKEIIVMIIYLLLLISFGIIMLASISTTPLTIK